MAVGDAPVPALARRHPRLACRPVLPDHPLGVVRVTIQTPDTRGHWDQREAEAAAAGLAVAAILEAAGDETATLAIHCWPAESGTQAHVYALSLIHI